MKRLLLMAVLFLMTATAMAIPAKPGLTRVLTLSNGSTVKATLVGDEHAHYWLGTDGKRYKKSGSVYVEVDAQALAKKALVRRRVADQKRKLRLTPERRKTVMTGSQKGLIILVQFTDVEFQEGHDQALFNDIANAENYTSDEGFVGSVADYFKDQSNSQFDLTFDVVGPVTVSHSQSYYGTDGTEEGDDQHAGTMVPEACNLVDSLVDFSDYDWDGDGEADQVFVLYAGEGQADGGDDDTIWPHEYYLSYSDYGSTLTLDGTIIDTYACANEIRKNGYEYVNGQLQYTYGLTGIGTICHEFSHCLGFPDLYDTTYSGYYGMGSWDLMCSGSYNGPSGYEGFVPAGYTAYEKMVAGWTTPVELSEETAVTGMKPLSQHGQTYIIYNEADSDEYYLLENRKLEGWDANLAAGGLLVTHVDYDENIWEANNVNSCINYSDTYGQQYAIFDSDHQRLTVVPADNEQSDDNEYGDPYPYNGLDSLTNASTPAVALWNKNTDGTKYLSTGIYDITVDDDGLVSFNAKPMASTAVSTEGAFFYESFDNMDGKGGNDDLWSGMIASKAMSSGEESLFDNEGWTYSSVYIANQCVKLGTSRKDGTLTSPSFTVSGDTKLAFNAGGWNRDGEGTTLTVSLTGDGVTLGQTTFTLTAGEWTTYTTTLTGSGTVQLSFTGDGRFFLDEVIVPGTSTGIRMVESADEQKNDQRVYNLNGQYLGTDLQSLPNGMYIVGGKKVVK